LTAESAADLKKSGPSKKLKNAGDKNCLLANKHYQTSLNFVSRSQPPGQNSTAAADICGSAVPSQSPAKIERLRGLNMRFNFCPHKFWDLGFFIICSIKSLQNV